MSPLPVVLLVTMPLITPVDVDAVESAALACRAEAPSATIAISAACMKRFGECAPKSDNPRLGRWVVMTGFGWEQKERAAPGEARHARYTVSRQRLSGPLAEIQR